MKNATILLAVVAMLAMAVPVAADTIIWNGDGDGASWGDTDNWDLNRLPQGGTAPNDFAKINNGDSVGLTGATGNAAGEARTMRVYNGSGLTVSGGTLVVNEGIDSGYGGSGGTTVLQTGGTITASIGVGRGNYGSQTGDSIYTFSGGTLTAVDIVVGDAGSAWDGGVSHCTSQFIVKGDGCTISASDDYTQSDNLTGSQGATRKTILEYIFTYDSGTGTTSGISKIAVTDDILGLGGTLKVTFETGASLSESHYVLMTYDTLATTEVFEAVNLPTGWSLEYGNETGTTHAGEMWIVPEPATMVLLGIGGIGVLIRRKRRLSK